MSDHVDQVMKGNNLIGLADKFNDTMERKYQSVKREPLGRSMTREYQWPTQANEGKIAFGLPSKELANAKEIIYPAGGALDEKRETMEMYKKTHGNFGPGEQRNREYNWAANPTIDNRPQTFSFGFGEQRLQNGAAKAVHAERTEESFPKTVIVKKTVEDVKAVQTDMLGTVKNLG